MPKTYVFVMASRNKAYNTPFDDFYKNYWIPVIKFTNKNYSQRIKIFLTFPISTTLDDLDVADIIDNIIVTDIEDTTRPGISLRFINVLERLIPAMEDTDFVLKTNASSFWIIDRLLAENEKLPTTHLYKGMIAYHNNRPFVSGAGILMSKDIALYITKNTDKICFEEYDDLDFSRLILEKGTELKNGTRYDFRHNLTYDQNLNNILRANFYHIRLKNGVDPAKDILFCKILSEYFGYIEK